MPGHRERLGNEIRDEIQPDVRNRGGHALRTRIAEPDGHHAIDPRTAGMMTTASCEVCGEDVQRYGRESFVSAARRGGRVGYDDVAARQEREKHGKLKAHGDSIALPVRGSMEKTADERVEARRECG